MYCKISQVASAALLASLAIGSQAASTIEPCALLSQQVAAAATEQNTTNTIVPAQTAYECLQSMPFRSDLAVKFIDEYTKYVQWQSTLEILRNPPPGYLSPPVEILGGLATIRNMSTANVYKSQYDFDMDLTRLILSANDGHFSLEPCSFGILVWQTETTLVSISSDGVQIPKLYTYEDAVALSGGSTVVSSVELINGIGAAASLEQLSLFAEFQDPDARYNSLLSNVPINGQGQPNTGKLADSGAIWPGVNNFNLTFANGTTMQMPLQASVFDGKVFASLNLTTGENLFERICIPPNTTSSAISRRSSITVTTPFQAPQNYPVPIVRDPYNLVVGYFPEDPLLTDVAVMSVPTFETTGPLLDGTLPDSSVPSFAEKAQEFVNKAIANGRKKMIIDVTSNSGGVVDSGFALLSVLFPNETIYSATRFRSHPAVDLITQVYSTEDNPELEGTPFFLPAQVKPDQTTNFSSVQELIGPYNILGVPSSDLVAEDNFALKVNPTDPINTEGLGSPLNGTTIPFAPEDIIIVTNGECQSTCTIFTNHMIGKGVRVVAFGGRPQPGPMQSIGGVKGSQVLPLSDIDNYASYARILVQNASLAGDPILNSTEMALFQEVMPIPLSEFPLKVTGGSVNFRNAFAPDNDVVPTQFIYEAAYCRLFYTAASVNAPEKYWASAANAVWGNGTCAYRLPGSLSEQSISLPQPAVAKTTPSRTVLGMLLAISKGIN
ncbi:hypothetical protein N7486_001269 [Penicillium sp. IBT 16267x]|nr:hypothetical protein N7486_001269 [Penicillium sp. IBT 16267x]